MGRTVYKQGATTGWTKGIVVARATIKLQGYKGTFRCRKGSFKSDFGDSGAPVLFEYGNAWYLAGIQFAFGSYFWCWEDVTAIF